ncbi:hypothetical protein QR680_016875 [Steinernema hermaphroditum]|uniref:Uncharacterized protein n=1 Tax=Steinernema hermaphroditum TaxID=289476 RepID=A0AA39HCK2_9BILA|nr:hypothetical protein QR680_016875 [Steinernema hermaphroditum]
MVRGQGLTNQYGKDAAFYLVDEISKYELLYHIGEKMPLERLEPEAREDWKKVMTVMRSKYPGVPEEFAWNAWRTIRGEYFRSRCAQKWRGRLPFLGTSEIPGRKSTGSNISDARIRTRRSGRSHMEKEIAPEPDASVVGPKRTPKRRPARRVHRREPYSPAVQSRQRTRVSTVYENTAEEPDSERQPPKRPRRRRQVSPSPVVRSPVDQSTVQNWTNPEVFVEPLEESISTVPSRESSEERPVDEEIPIDKTFKAIIKGTWLKIEKKAVAEMAISELKAKILETICALVDEMTPI